MYVTDMQSCRDTISDHSFVGGFEQSSHISTKISLKNENPFILTVSQSYY